MRFFAGGTIYDFMRFRAVAFTLSFVIVFGSLGLLLFGNPRLGTDFRGGTEVEVAFRAPTTPGEIRSAVESAGFGTPDVIKVDDAKNPHRYLIRVHEVSTIAPEKQREIERALCFEGTDPACTPAHKPTEIKFSPGGDKISLRYHESPDLAFVKERISGVKQIALRAGDNNPMLQSERDNKVEIQLMSKGDQLLAGLRRGLGADRVPDSPLRAEWIGPRAGAQLRDSAIKSIAISIVFIMLYIAFRFDLRFAPGAVISLVHDAVGMLGIFILLGKEINLTTVAAALGAALSITAPQDRESGRTLSGTARRGSKTSESGARARCSKARQSPTTPFRRRPDAHRSRRRNRMSRAARNDRRGAKLRPAKLRKHPCRSLQFFRPLGRTMHKRERLSPSANRIRRRC